MDSSITYGGQVLFRRFCISTLLVALMSSQVGCAEVRKVVKKSWHAKFDWRADLYFEDSQVIALCNAIEAEDLQEIDRLVAAGVNVNARGKGNMTPLLWAFPDNKPERFKRLLEHGADPNVIFQSDFNTGQTGSFPGGSITHMAAKTRFPKYFEYVFQHGGDPNLEKTSLLGRGETPLFTVLNGATKEKKRIELLLGLKADLNHESATGMMPVRLAVVSGQYDTALLLLNAGADHRKYKTDHNSRLIHIVITQEHRLPQCTPQQKKDYQNLVAWLKAHGESFEAARADLERWKSWGVYPRAKQAELRKKEIAERKAREKHEKAAAEQ